jgi:hypothetical protein
LKFLWIFPAGKELNIRPDEIDRVQGSRQGECTLQFIKRCTGYTNLLGSAGFRPLVEELLPETVLSAVAPNVYHCNTSLDQTFIPGTSGYASQK